MAGSIATAYVQVMPSMQGVKGNLEKEFGAEGSSSGSIFGSSLVKKALGLISVAQLGKALGAALSEGAELQQSIGGIETLFQDSADTVIKNAEQAYKTAGLPASSYMEMVTGFSASLLQGLSGDTEAAAAIADMAMTDMADNANKMGTDMESIQNAYQGFAKQNYTMLDNLKLGYGGTKSEMERLLADAQALTGVEYDISNLADVYSAIHVIQGELGITGTTALEASETFSGSLAAMKAAAQNVLGNLALGQAMGPSLQALAQTTGTFLTGNLLPMVLNILTALPGAAVTFLQALLPGSMQSIVTTAVTAFSAFMSGSLPTILENGTTLITGLVTGFLSAIPEFLSAAGSLLLSLTTAILGAVPTLLSNGVSLILGLASGILTALPNIVSSGAAVVTNLITTIAGYLPDLLAQGISLVGKLVAGLISMIPDVIDAGVKIAGDLLNSVMEVDWPGLGSDIIKGVVQGVKNAASSLYEALKELAREALAAAKNALGIKSPSRVFRDQVGRMIPAGMAAGILGSKGLVTEALDSLTDTAAADMTAALRISGSGSASGTQGVSGGRVVNFVQNVYSRAMSEAELARETRYQAELEVLMGV